MEVTSSPQVRIDRILLDQRLYVYGLLLTHMMHSLVAAQVLLP